MGEDTRPRNRRNEQLGEVGQANDADECSDRQFKRTKAGALKQQQPVGHYRRDHHAAKQRHVKQQRQSDCTTEKFSQIGCHRGNFADAPHAQHDRFRKPFAAQLRKVSPGDDAELRRERLKLHRHKVGQQHDPEQRVAVSGAGLNIRRKVARIHIGNRDHHGRPGERQKHQRTAAAAFQYRSYRKRGALGSRRRSGCLMNAIVQALAPCSRD
ncbi:hypothetical protein KCU90_g3941, partial [Aureobasidium melanogenum]